MSWAAAATVGGSLLSGALGGGGGGGAAAMPTSFDTKMGDVTFGSHYIGDAAVGAAPSVIAAQNTSWTKYLPWIIGGVVALFLGAVLILKGSNGRGK